MANQLALKGAQPSKQTRYAPMWTGRFFSGVITQRSPLRGNITRLEEAYYGSRGDEMLSGLNTEISPKLTLIRRPGLSVYNSNLLPAVNRFYEFRTLVNNLAQIKVLADLAPQSPATVGTVRDVTGPSNDFTLWAKTAGSGITSFQSVGNTLYASDLTSFHKWTIGAITWSALTNIPPGTLITDGNGNLQLALGGVTLPIIASSSNGTVISLYVNPFNVPSYFANMQNVPMTFSGLTAAAILNSTTHPITIVSPTLGIFTVPVAIAAYAETAETGSATSGTGITGATIPPFSGTEFVIVSDGGQLWKSYGSAIQNGGLAAPTLPPTLTPLNGTRFWQPNTLVPSSFYSILDNNGNVQWAATSIGGTFKTGLSYPTWVAYTDVNSGLATTLDGTILWRNLGPILSWAPNSNFTPPLVITQDIVILDSNGNLQVSSGGTTGATQPVWMTTIGAVTTGDGTRTWTCFGPGKVITSQSIQYAFSTHAVDGSVSTASPVSLINGGILGPAAGPYIAISGTYTPDPQIDQIWVWRTVQGGSTLFLEDEIPIDPFSGVFTYDEYGIPDTSLNILIQAPIDETNNPPPVGLQALSYHLQRIWGAIGNLVYYSDGPDVISGNGNTAWSPSNVFAFPETVIRLFPTSSGLIVFTLSDVFIIQGLGIAASPLTSLPLLQDVGLSSYDAFTVNGSIVYMYTSDNQIVSLDPSSGVSEIGFAIGDQFGPGNGTNTFTPLSARLTWHIAGSIDKGLYVSDFYGNWWRMSPTPSPETGITWSPMANFIPSIGGFSAVQSVETSPGTHSLLLGPPNGIPGPILQRNYSVQTDNVVPYKANAVIGSLVLAQPGQLALVESLTTDSVAIGTPISLAVQLDEIAPLSSGYFETLSDYVPDPTELSPSNSVYAQRFYLSQTQQPAVCRHLQIEVDFGSDTVQNELLSMTLFGGFEQEK